MVAYEDEEAFITNLPKEEIYLRYPVIVQCSANFEVVPTADAPYAPSFGKVAILTDGLIHVHRNTKDSYVESVISSSAEVKVSGIYRAGIAPGQVPQRNSKSYEVDGYECTQDAQYGGIIRQYEKIIHISKDGKTTELVDGEARIEKIESVGDDHIILHVKYGGNEYDEPGWQLTR
jgi:hypothetical protein